MLSILLSSSSSTLCSLSRSSLYLSTRTKTTHLSTMSINLQFHAFAGNPIRSKTPKQTDPFSPNSALETLKTLLLENTNQNPLSKNFKVLPFRKGRPLACSNYESLVPIWHLGWLNLSECKSVLENSKVVLDENKLVYLGGREEEEEGVVYWAVDVSEDDELVGELGKRKCCFVELRTLMVATDWADANAMGELAIAGHVSRR